MAILALPYACLGAQLDRPKWDLQGKRLWRVAGLLPPCMQLQQSEAVSATWVLPELFGNTCRQHRMLEWIGPQRYARAPTLISARCALPKFPLQQQRSGRENISDTPFPAHSSVSSECTAASWISTERPDTESSHGPVWPRAPPYVPGEGGFGAERQRRLCALHWRKERWGPQVESDNISTPMCCCGGSGEGTGLTVATKPELDSVGLKSIVAGGHMCVYTCPDPQTVHHQGWALHVSTNDPIVFLFMAE